MIVTIKAIRMVPIIIGSDCNPVATITFKFNPKPKKTIAVWRIYLEVKLIPVEISPLSFHNYLLWRNGLCNSSVEISPLSFHNRDIIIPRIIAMIGPPMMGNAFPNIHDGIAKAKQITTP